VASILAIWTLAILEVNGCWFHEFRIRFCIPRSILRVRGDHCLDLFQHHSLRDAIRRANKSERLARFKLRAAGAQSNTGGTRLRRTVELSWQTNTMSAAPNDSKPLHSSAAITSSQNLESLLPVLVQVISEQFGFYHSGIFCWMKTGKLQY